MFEFLAVAAAASAFAAHEKAREGRHLYLFRWWCAFCGRKFNGKPSCSCPGCGAREFRSERIL